MLFNIFLLDFDITTGTLQITNSGVYLISLLNLSSNDHDTILSIEVNHPEFSSDKIDFDYQTDVPKLYYSSENNPLVHGTEVSAVFF